ncbi:MAG: hypothetical protein EBU93_08085, partial [Chlamydiae bacterium]|nr:hypothetical protein [Chlamydiota bacterium]
DPELENQKAEKQEDDKQESEKQEDVTPKDKQETSNANKEKVNTPTSKNKEVAKKPKPKPQEVKKKAATDKDLDSLLKNLEKNSTGNNKTKAVNRKKTEESEDAFGSFDETMPESLTNYELIKQQIMKKWNQPIASSTENIIITLRIALDIDGSVLKAEVTKILCPSGKDAVCLATRDSVRRAAIKASPLENLSQSDYDEWKELDVHFDTRR